MPTIEERLAALRAKRQPAAAPKAAPSIEERLAALRAKSQAQPAAPSVTGTAEGQAGVSTAAPSPYTMERPLSNRALDFADQNSEIRQSMRTPDTVYGLPTNSALSPIVNAAKAVSNTIEAVPAQFREANRSVKYGNALLEFNNTGKITLQLPQTKQVPSTGFGLGPSTMTQVDLPGKYLEGEEAKQYLKQLSTPEGQDAEVVRAFKDESSMPVRAVASVLSQPKQLGSVAGAMAGSAVGMPMLGAAAGMTPQLYDTFYSEYGKYFNATGDHATSVKLAAARLGIEGITEMLPGVGKLTKALEPAVGKAATQSIIGFGEEASAEGLGIGLDMAARALSDRPKLYDALIPKTAIEGISQITEAGIGGAIGGAVITGGVSALESGINTVRQRLSRPLEVDSTKTPATPVAPIPIKETGPRLSVPEANTEVPLTLRETRDQRAGLEPIKGAIAGNRIQQALANNPALVETAAALPKEQRDALFARIAKGYPLQATMDTVIENGPVTVDQRLSPSTPAPIKPRIRPNNFSMPTLPEGTVVSTQTAGAVKPRLTLNGASIRKRVTGDISATPIQVPMEGTTSATINQPRTITLPKQEITTNEESQQQRIEGQREGQGQEGLLIQNGLSSQEPTSEPVAQPPVAARQAVSTPTEQSVEAPTQSPIGRRLVAPTQGYPSSISDLATAVRDSSTDPSNDFHSKMIERYAASPNAAGVKVEIVRGNPAAENSPLRIVRNDGTVTSAGGRYYPGRNTIYLPESITPEVAVHEVQHSVVTRALTLAEAGQITDPAALKAVGDLKSALSVINNIDTSTMSPGTAERVKYAGKNALELMAILGSSPEVVQALDKMKATVDVTVTTPRTRLTTELVEPSKPWIKTKLDQIVDAYRRLIGKPVKDRRISRDKSEEYLHQEIKKVLLTASVNDSSKALEATDVSAAPFDIGSTEVSSAMGRLMGRDSSVSAPSTSNISAVASARGGINPYTQEPTNPVLKAGIKPVKWFKDVAYAERNGSKTTFDMLQEMGGTVRAMDHVAIQRIQEVEKQAKATLGKRWKSYNDVMVDHLLGNPSVALPKELAGAIASTRRYLDKLSLSLLASGAVPAKDTKKFLANLGRYTHRGYKAWDLKPGEWRNILHTPGGKGIELFDKLLPKVLEDMRIPDDAALDTMQKVYEKDENATVLLDRLFYQYGLATPKGKDIAGQVAGNVQRLKSIASSATPEVLVEHARLFMDRMSDPKTQIQGESDMPYKDKIFSTDNTALKQKSDVPPWLREIWGEYQEFDAHVINTVRSVEGLLAKFQVLASWKSKLLSEGIIVKGTVPRGYTELKSSRTTAYGPLDGYSIRDQDAELVKVLGTQGVAEAMLFQSGITEGNKLSKAIQKVSSLSKINQILLDFGAFTANLVSSVGTLALSAGNPIRLAKNVGKATEISRREALGTFPWYLGGKGTKEAEVSIEATIKYLITKGVLADAALSQDMRNEMKEMVLDEAYQNATQIRRKGRAVKSFSDSLIDGASRLNAFGDSLAKVTAFYTRLQHLKEVYPGRSDKELMAIAAVEVRDTMPSYALAIPATKSVARKGIVAPFAPFFGEVMLRNPKNEMKLVAKYMKEKSPAAKKYAAYQAAGLIAKMSAVSVGGYVAQSLVAGLLATGSGDDEEKKGYKAAMEVVSDSAKAEAFRTLSPDYTRGAVIPLRQMPDGKWTYSSLARFDAVPYGQMVDALRRGKWDEALNVFTGPFASFSMTFPALTETVAGITQMSTGRGESGKREGKERALKYGEQLALKTFVPGILVDTIVNPLKRGAEGTDFTAAENAMSQIGMTVSVLDVPRVVADRLKDYTDTLNSATGEMTYNLSKPNVMDSLEDEFNTYYADIVLAKKDLLTKYRPTIEAARAMGMDNSDIANLVQDYNVQGMGKDNLYDLLDGTFTLPDPTDSIIRQFETEMDKADGNDAKVEQLQQQLSSLVDLVQARREFQAEVLRKSGMKEVQL